MKPLFILPALVGLLSLSPLPSRAAPGPRYTVVPLQALPGAESEETAHAEPHALNNQGESVGEAGAHEQFKAVHWDAWGKITRLGKPSDGLTDARDINDRGQVIAYVTESKTFPAARLFLVDATGAHLIAPPVGTETMGFEGGEAINNAGQTAFNTQTDGSLPIRAFLDDHGALTDLGHLPLRDFEANFDQVNVHALSNSGMAAGYSQISLKDADGLPLLPTHAFLWQKGKMTDLGVLPGYDDSSATALNDKGDVVGTMSHQADNDSAVPFFKGHGFLWHSGHLTDLGTLPGCRDTEPMGINNRGQIVGNSYNIVNEGGGSFSQSGGALGSGVFLWQNGKMIDLQRLVPPDWQLQTAVAINDRGDILCTGYHLGMPSRDLGCGAFLLRPH